MGVSAAIIGAGVLGAAGQIGSSAIAANSQPSAPDPTYTGGNIMFDPLITGTSLLGMAGLGLPVDTTQINMMSPIMQALNANISTVPQSNEAIYNKVRLVQEIMSRIERGDTDWSRDESSYAYMILKQIAGSAGMSLEDLVQQQLDFNTNKSQYSELFDNLSSQNAEIRSQATQQLAELSANLPKADAATQQALAALAQERITRDVNRIAQEQTTAQLQMANAGNYNPGRAIGDIAEAQQRALQDSYLQSLAEASQIIGQQQALAGNQQSILQAFISPEQQNAANLAAIRAGALSGGPVSITPPQQPNTGAIIGQGIEGATSTLGTSLANYAQYQQNQELLKILLPQAPAYDTNIGALQYIGNIV